jgi:isopenicillin N synthase-like dioxygenase
MTKNKQKKVLDYVPVFDMALLFDADQAAFKKFAKNQFGPATSANGFCRWTLTPEIKVLEDAHFEKALLFHALPEAVKQGFRSDVEQMGYKGLKTVAKRRKKNAVPDQKTYFMIEQGLGRAFNQVSQNVLVNKDDGKHINDYVPGYADSILDLMVARQGVAKRVLEAVALYLDVTQDSLAQYIDGGKHAQRDLYYPPCQNPQQGAMRIDTHKDKGLLTLLRAENGLEVLDQKDVWHALETQQGEWISNGGLQLEIFSNGLYRAAPHRVKMPDDLAERQKPRYANPWFGSSRPATLVTPLQELVSKTGQNNYPYAMTVDDLGALGTRQYIEENDKLKNQKINDLGPKP